MLQYLNRNIVNKRIIIIWEVKSKLVIKRWSQTTYKWSFFVIASAFEANHGKQMFGNGWKLNSCAWAPTIPVLKTQAHWKQLNASFSVETCTTVHVNSDTCLYCSGRTGSGPKLNALNRVRPSKKIKLNFFIFNYVLLMT